jgi:hypothetical protein
MGLPVAHKMMTNQIQQINSNPNRIEFASIL